MTLGLLVRVRQVISACANYVPIANNNMYGTTQKVFQSRPFTVSTDVPYSVYYKSYTEEVFEAVVTTMKITITASDLMSIKINVKNVFHNNSYI